MSMSATDWLHLLTLDKDDPKYWENANQTFFNREEFNNPVLPESAVTEKEKQQEKALKDMEFFTPPDVTPYDMDANVYDYATDKDSWSTEAVKKEKLDALKQRIAEVKSQIADLSKESDLTDKLSILEGRKIGTRLEKPSITNIDPTFTWRWNEGRKDLQRQQEATKQQQAEAESRSIDNEIDMWENTPISSSTEGVEQQISNLLSTIKDAKDKGANGQQLERLNTVLSKLQGSLSADGVKGTKEESLTADYDKVLKSNSITDINNFIKNNGTDGKLTQDQLNKLKNRTAQLYNAAVDKKAREKAKKANAGRDVWDNLTLEAKAKYKAEAEKDLKGGK